MSENNSTNGKDMVEYLNLFFEKLAGFIHDHKWTMAWACFMVLGVFAYFASTVRFDNSYESFFAKDDPVYQEFLKYRADFGSDEISYILYDAPDKPDGAWDINVMKTIGNLTRDLETRVPFVKRVVSLANVEFVEGKDDTLSIHDLLKPFPESQDKLIEIRDKVLVKPMYVGGLTNSDGRYGAIILDMEKSSVDPLSDIMVDPEKGDRLSNLYPQATCAAIDGILERYNPSGIRFYHSGDVAVNAAYNIISQHDSTFLGGITFLVIGILLFVFFRNVMGVIGPLFVVCCSLMMTVGFMGMLGWQLDIIFIMLPTILIAVGVADSIHLITDFNTHFMSLNDRREAIKKTVYQTGVPCLFTSLTTMAGFVSMGISPIKLIKRFAIYSSFGVACAFVLSMTLLIVFMSFGKKESPKARQKNTGSLKKVSSLLTWIAEFNIRHKGKVVLVSLALFAVSAFGITRLTIDSNFLSEFSDRVEVKRVTEHVDSVMGGSMSYSYIFDTGVEDGIMDPKVLAAMEKLQQKAEEDDIVLKTYSVVDLIKDINRSLHNEDDAYYRLPKTLQESAQYFLLYEMSGGDELSNFVAGNFSRANLEIRTSMEDSSRVKQLVQSLDETIQSMGLTIEKPYVTGIGALWYRLIDYIVESQINGFTLAFIVISIFMCILFRSVKVGLLSMIPNLAPVVLTLGAMGWAGIPLDFVKLLIGCIVIGIAVDDTIHLVNRYRYVFAQTGDYEKALRQSMPHVGRALIITSFVLVCGFLALTFSVMASMVQFAILVASTLVVALAADFLLLPSLLLMLRPFSREKAVEVESGLGYAAKTNEV